VTRQAWHPLTTGEASEEGRVTDVQIQSQRPRHTFPCPVLTLQIHSMQCTTLQQILAGGVACQSDYRVELVRCGVGCGVQ